MQQKTKTETEPKYKSLRSTQKMIAAIAAVLALGIGPSQVAFSYGGPSSEQASTPIVESDIQTFATALSSDADIAVPLESMTVEVVSEPEPEPEVVVEEAPVAAPASPSYNGGGLLAAARSQLGWSQDCTALVENSLRMLGYSVGDLAPMSFGGYGIQVAQSEAQPGDIMMRPGHVAIYAGGGVAIHGGWQGYTTVESSYASSPYDFSVIIRVQ